MFNVCCFSLFSNSPFVVSDGDVRLLASVRMSTAGFFFSFQSINIPIRPPARTNLLPPTDSQLVNSNLSASAALTTEPTTTRRSRRPRRDHFFFLHGLMKSSSRHVIVASSPSARRKSLPVFSPALVWRTRSAEVSKLKAHQRKSFSGDEPKAASECQSVDRYPV